VTCQQCGSENRPEARFCSSCGHEFEVPCPVCGLSILATRPFCDGCGARRRPESSPSSYHQPLLEGVLASRSASEGERKLVTVMFVDVVRSTEMAEALDPEAVRGILDGFFRIALRSVHRYEGTVNQFTGDGVMALFGAPIAHEDHAVRALHSALAMREDLKKYDVEVQQRWGHPCRVRMGINTGVVVVGPIGDNLRLDYTASGLVTNLAARLQQMAPPWAIWVSQATHRLAGTDFAWQTLAPLNVEGLKELVSAHALVDLQPIGSGKFDEPGERNLTPFIGRERELRQFQEAWSEARLGRGRVVSVMAEAGLGKTRLLHEFKRSLKSDGPIMLCEGSCFDHGKTSAYLPFRELLKSLFQLDGVGSEEEGARRVTRGVEQLRLDSSLAAAVLNVLSYTVPDESFRAVSAQVVRDRTVAALRAVIKAVAARQPLVLVIEDLHWIDQATQEVVNGLVDDAKTSSLLLVLVFRPEYVKKWGEVKAHSQIALEGLPGPSSAEMVRAVLSRPHATWVALRQISPQQSAEMVRQILDSNEIPQELEQLVSRSTEGNPLFIEELIVSLIERGALKRQGDEWVFDASPESLKVPDRVQNLFAARVDRLTDELKELLKLASVIGRVFNSAILAKVSEAAPLEGSLRDLEALELIYRMPETSPPAYSFKHALCQDAVYGQLRDGKKKQYHEQVARAIESLYPDRLDEHCELLVHHYACSAALPEIGDSVEIPQASGLSAIAEAKKYPERVDKAVEYLRRANRKAIGVSAMADAKKYYNRAYHALTLLSKDGRNEQRRLQLVLDQVFVALALFTYRDYYALLREHADLAETLGDRRLLGAFHARVGWCQWSIGDFVAGIETLDRAVEHCKATRNDEDLGFALMTRAWCELDRGDFFAALASCEDALHALDRKFELQSYVRTRAAATAVNAYLGRWEQAIEQGKKAMEIAEQYGDAGATSFAAMVATWNYAFMGDLEQALATADFAVSRGTAPADQLFAQGSRALVQCKMGHAAQAANVLADVVAVIRPMKFPACETFGLYYCEALFQSGELAKAKLQLGECLKVIEPSDARFYVACARRLLGEVALAEGGEQLSAAAGYFESSIAMLEKLGAENELALAWTGYARLHQKMGDRGVARQYLTRALSTFERLGTRIEPDRLRRTLAELG
jgi:predicted ATPase/class 3 adenylate cyclase